MYKKNITDMTKSVHKICMNISFNGIVLTWGDPGLISAFWPPRCCRCDHRRDCSSRRNTPVHCWGSGWAPSHCPPTRCPANYLTNTKHISVKNKNKKTIKYIVENPDNAARLQQQTSDNAKEQSDYVGRTKPGFC